MRISTTTSAALAISLLAMSVSAATTTSDTALPSLSGTSTSDSSATTTDSSSDSSSTDASSSGTGSSSASGTASSTDSSSGTATTTGSALPGITSDAGLTGFPTLSGAYSYPAASVPPTSNAPYMRTSSYPEGTVFIAVGSILGAAAVAVLAWRGLVAWALHRSVKRAANTSSMADVKSQFRTPATPFYRYTDGESTMSLANMVGKSKDKKSKTAASTPAAQALFFSPTAAKGQQGGNRGSSYLPAGYYAAGTGNTAANSRDTGFSLTNLGPPMQGYARTHSIGTTPPDSPSMRARDEPRAPSAYLDDMIDEGAERGNR